MDTAGTDTGTVVAGTSDTSVTLSADRRRRRCRRPCSEAVVVVVTAASGECERDEDGERRGGCGASGRRYRRRSGAAAVGPSQAASASPIGVDGGPSANGHSSSAIRR